MIITCSSCSARYQLADAKIKLTGTKVRCPRCSNKFVVFPESKDSAATHDVLVERTEAYQRDPSTTFAPDAELLRKSKNLTVPPKKQSEQQSVSTRIQQPRTPLSEEEPTPSFDFDSEAFEQSTRAYDAGESPAARQLKQKAVAKSKPELAEEDEATPVMPPREEFLAPSEAKAQKAETNLDTDMDQTSEHPEAGAASEISESEIRPFGAETLFEIQKADKRRRFPKPLALVASLLLIGGIGYFVYPTLQNQFFSTSDDAASLDSMPDSTLEPEPAAVNAETPKPSISKPPPATIKMARMERPSGWYRDDPAVYQDEMVRQAGLPAGEKERPNNVGLLAEALVLHGVLTSDQTQVNQGLLFAQKLQLEHPGEVVSFYAISANAVASNQLSVMRVLYERWPEAARGDAEFKLLEFMSFAQEGMLEVALGKAQELLKASPEFQRANDYAYLLILQNGSLASKVMEKRVRDQIANRYELAKNARERSLGKLPSLYFEIESLLGRKPKTPNDSVAKEQETRIVPRQPEVSDAKSNNQTQTASVQNKRPPAASKDQPSAKGRGGNRLPPPSKDLVNQTQQDTQAKRDARKALNDGNEAYKKGNVDGALAAYRQALKLDPEFADVYKRLGILYMEQKRNDRALRSFRIYLQLRPDSTDKKTVEGWMTKLQ